MSRLSFFWLIFFLFAGRIALGADSDGDLRNRQHLDFFESKIRPVLVEHCYECHSEQSKTLQGGLLLDSRAGVLNGGDSGEAVVVGDSEASLLIDSLEYGEDSFQMPPKGRLSDETIAAFRRWVNIGLPDPRDGVVQRSQPSVDVEAARDFWSFRPIVRPSVPSTRSGWSLSEIDQFVEHKITAANLRPASDADSYSLVRRIYFDLIGLPPSIEQIDEFLESVVESGTDIAVGELVDNLLESDRFGERWARHWLDVVRYAESSGGGRTLIFPNAWRYRDYVIRSFNADRRYDEFLKEQIAGDLLQADSDAKRREQLVATSFLALGPTNYELQDKELLRMEVIDEQLDTIGRSMLGLTLGCARCHDHKFDPIPTRDYYAMAGIFRSTKTFTLGNVANFIERPLPSKEFDQQVRIHDEKTAAVKSDLKNAETEMNQLKAKIRTAFGEVDLTKWDVTRIDTDRAELVGTWVKSTSVSGFVGENYLHDGNAKKGKNRVVFSLDLPPEHFELQASYTPGSNRATNVIFRVHHASGVTDIEVNQQTKPPIDGQFTSLGEFSFSAEQKGKVELVTDGTDGHVIADAIRWIPHATATTKPGDDETRSRNLYVGLKSKIARLQDQIAQLKKQKPVNPQQTMSVLEEAEPGDWHVHVRGQVRNLGPIVPRGFIGVVGTATASIPVDHSGRLQLANWIANDANPLTARVIVNRIWQHLIGEGIVRTPDNFGSMGRPPTHPELIDHLANEFLENGWSIKNMIRQIMNSRVYRLGEQVNLETLNADPGNELICYRKPRRLDAESLRDAMLAVSGKIDLTMFGKTQKQGTKSEVAYQFSSNRRSVYVPWFRNTQLDALQIFDAANPNVVTGRRTVTSMPTQALFLLNSEFLHAHANAFAERLLAVQRSDTDRMNRAYLMATGRPIRESEQAILLDFIAEQRDTETPESDVWTQVCHLILASVDFRST